MKLFLALHEPEQFYDSSNSERYAVCILSICHVEYGRTALYFAREEREVHVPCTHEEGPVGEVANKWPKFLKLRLSECFSSEPHRVIRLRARFR